MKSLLLTAALVLSASSAMAMTTHADLTGPARAQAERIVPNGDFDNLTAAQVNAIESILASDNDNRGGQIRAILN
ncbi:hypothetical protein OEZ71_19140 [Defluviimonas sp. WL0050]|uniref:Uncharacterized protein n=1 Tax=Albidovulum litorale TaxID=2984134 RepID=A0ABT2ZTE2_9RHOB|nr:hypothetical protein [Defluviimonas sp. WL0050]MCV2874419.1 hypothetical protein [Defluviimonas sp. WL0050]